MTESATDTNAASVAALRDLIDQYVDIAYEEGAEGNETGDAERVRSEIEAVLRSLAAAPQQPIPPLELSAQSRAMLLNVLWHHQGGSSPAGQPIRRMLGIGQHDHLTAEQVEAAKSVEHAIARAAVEADRAQRKPLTREQRRAIFDTCKYEGEDVWEIDCFAIIDAVERAHGIRGMT